MQKKKRLFFSKKNAYFFCVFLKFGRPLKLVAVAYAHKTQGFEKLVAHPHRKIPKLGKSVTDKKPRGKKSVTDKKISCPQKS